MLQFARLSLAGFKSFVDPVNLSIDAGLTGIVGPNGCGKSNLVEALRWVMGESSARQMRGGEMDDVIFGGTDGRPARQIAEVVIDLDNAADTAPPPWHDQNTLSIRRRIERGRGSGYRINGREVRARDVQLLFADAATGARSTALLGQGQVGQIINARPRERRLILEEAAGITGLHARRHEAELRLRAAAANLERVDDVLAALETQLRTLHKQARQAARYRSVSDRVRAAELLVFALSWREAAAAADAAALLLRGAEADVVTRTTAATAAEARRTEAAAGLPELRRAEAEAAAEKQRLALALETLMAEERRLAEDRAAASTRLDQTTADLTRERARVTEATAALEQAAEEQRRIRTRQAGEAADRPAAAAALAAADTAVQTLDAERVDLNRAVAARDAARAALQRALADAGDRRDRLAARRRDLDAQTTALAAERAAVAGLDDVAAAATAADRAWRDAQDAAKAADAGLAGARQSHESARDAKQAALAEVARWRAEEDALQAVLAAPDATHAPPVADGVTAADGLEAALAAALGDDLLAPAEPGGEAYWALLGSSDTPPPLPDGATPLADLLTAPAALARRLVQVGLVADAATGDRLQANLRQGQRLVTAEGGLWRWDGFTATPSASAPAARLRQRARLREVTNRRAAAETAAADVTSQAEAAAQALAQATATADAATALVRDNDTRRQAARQAESDLRQRHDRVLHQTATLDAAAAGLDADLAEAESAHAAAATELASLPEAADLRTRLATLTENLTTAQGEQRERRAAVDAVDRDAAGRRRRLERLEAEAAAWVTRRDAAAAQAEDLDRRRQAALADVERLAERPEHMARRRAELMTESEAADVLRRTQADRVAAAEAVLAEADRAARAADSALAADREAKVRAEGQVEQADAALAALARQIAAATDVLPEDLATAAGLDTGATVPDLDTARTRLERLKRERETMGPVNLCAEQEAADLEEQMAALLREKGDLEEAIGKLRQGVSELTREGRKRLLASFDAVDRRFQELFVRLFDGGHAHLSLVESDDPLDAGLEIMASPPGKKLQALSLLSGGEQALATLALVFAVFLTNPAPLCVLDEVDAPLDDANVDRFCTLLDEMAADGGTRFLVITHHRMTMARMHRLFGVTMSERGVSQLVSVDLGRAEELRRTG